MPLTFGMLPPVQPDDAWDDHDVIASPEWFGDGHQSFRQVLVRRELADVIAAASPRDFRVQTVPLCSNRDTCRRASDDARP
jgi:hypothetical protein